MRTSPPGSESSRSTPPRLRIAADRYDVAIVGGGFAGAIVAVQLARQAERPLRIVMYDRAGAFGRGAAYSPVSDACLLNVRAKAMGAFPEAEGDFLAWLRARGYGQGDPDLGERFLPRRLYGDYVCSLLERSTGGDVVVERRSAAVCALSPAGDGYTIETACATRTTASAVVLAIGNLPPGGFGTPALTAAMRAHARNSWDVLAGEAIDRDAGVLIVGTGLTSLDLLLHLTNDGHRGKITMLSRHGRFPLAHGPSAGASSFALPAFGDGKPRDVLRAVRAIVRDVVASGQSWHTAIDALRPHANRVWQSWTPAEQRQFYRHIAPLWEIHRHRAPQSTLDVRDRLIAAGRLNVHRGRLVSLAPDGDALRAAFVAGESGAETVLRADVVIDATGPRRSITDSGDPLIASLFERGLANPGALGLGFAATADGALSAAPRAPLYTLGTPLRGTLCETTAVREIRVQARAIAQAVTAAIAPASDAPLLVAISS